MPTYVDTHCHLDHHDGLDTAAQVERARDQGVELMITIGTTMADSTRAVQTAARFDGVFASVGIHPNDAMEATPHVLDVIDKLAQQDQVVAIGETGLDYYRDHTSPEQQQQAFRAHIELAKRHDKTLVIHCRDTASGGVAGPAWLDTLDLLAEVGAPDRVVMHCFSGNTEITERCVEAGYFVSFAGNVTFKNAEALRVAAKAAPPELLLTETDSPFLTPVPHRGQPNEPANIPHVLATLADVQGLDEEKLAGVVLDNAVRAFQLPVDRPPVGRAVID